MSVNRADRDEIAIVGIGCKFPDADNYMQFWNNLSTGKNAIRDIISRTMVLDGTEYSVGRWDEKFYSKDNSVPNTSNSRWCGLIERIDEFDNQFFNITPREAKNMDPQQRLLLQETWHCIEDSGVPLHDLQMKKTGVLVGVMTSDYHQEISNEEIIIDSYAGLGNYDCILANRISYHFGFTGISMAADAACASSLVAIHQGRNSLLNYESDYILAGGVALNSHPWKYISFSKSRMLSPDGQCKTFDKNANGYVPGEGVAMILMQRLEDAKASGNHIYGIIKGSHVNHCGFSRSITAPSIASQEELIKRTFDTAQVRPNSISYVEAHGTGTSLGDPIEIEALSRAFRNYIPSIIGKEEFEKEIISWIESGKVRDFVKECFDELPDQKRRLKQLPDKKRVQLENILRSIKYISNNKQYCKIGSLKTNLGHLEACAGIAGVIKVLMMMKYRQIPPTLNLTTPNPIVNWDSTPFTLAGFKKGLSRFSQSLAAKIGVRTINPVLFNEKTINDLADALLTTYDVEINKNLSDPSKTGLITLLSTLAIKELKVERKKISPNETLYKKSEQWYPPEINILVQLLKFKYRITVVNDEIIHSLSIDDIADLLVSIQKESLEEYYADGEQMPDYKLVLLIVKDLVEAVADIFNIPASEVDISKNIGTFQKTPLRAAVSSFGFGGVNSHLILEEFPQIYREEKERYPFNLFLLSAKTEKSLEKMRQSWQLYQESRAFQKFSIRDICSNLMVGREQFPHRLGFVLSDKKEFSHSISEAETCICDNKKLIAIRVGDIEWRGFSQFEYIADEIPLFTKILSQIQSILSDLHIYKTVRDGMYQKTWSPKYRKLYSFIINITCIKMIAGLGLKIDLVIPDKGGAILSLVIAGMISIKDAILLFEQQLTVEELTLGIPHIPLLDPISQTTIAPYSFDERYLQNLIKGLSTSDNDLDHLYIDTLLESNSNDSSVRLATIFKREGLINEAEMQEYLSIHEKTGFELEDILREKKRKITQEEIAECLQENELLSYYVDDIIHVDTARQLNENQYTFKGYIDEWNQKLNKTHSLDITQILERESSRTSPSRGSNGEKELLLIIISSSLQRLNERWKIKREQRSHRQEFNEIIDLLCDGVLLKEDCISLLLDKHPNYAEIAQRVQTNQFKCNKTKSYDLISTASVAKLRLGVTQTLKNWTETVDSQITATEHLHNTNCKVIDKNIHDFHMISFGSPKAIQDVARYTGKSTIQNELKHTLLTFWSKGYNLKWHKVVHEGSYKRLALPLYPFEKRSFWLHGEEFNHDLSQDYSNKGIFHRFIRDKSTANTVDFPNEEYTLFEPQYRELPITQTGNTKTTIVWSETIPEAWSPSFHCQKREDLELIFERLEEDQSCSIIFNWDRDESQALGCGIDELFDLCKLLSQTSSTAIKRVLFYAFQNTNTLPIVSSIAQGMFYSLQKELPHIEWKCIRSDKQLPFSLIEMELTENEWHQDVRYQKGKRQVRSTDQLLQLQRSRGIQKGGVYIIAGGSGALGQKLSKQILNTEECTVISLGRKSETPQTEAMQSTYHGSAKRYRHYQWNPKSLLKTQQLFTEITDTYGPIKGVFNCTGMVEDALFFRKNRDSLQRVIATKVGSTLTLHSATKDEPLDFFVLFSSIVSDIGNMGQVDYAGANSFLNAFAHYRNEKNFPGSTLALKCTLFKNGGMGLSKEAKQNFSTKTAPENPGIIECDKVFDTILSLLHLRGEISLVTNKKYQNIPPKKEKSIQVEESNTTEQFLRNLISEKCNIHPENITAHDALFNLGIGSLGIHEIAAQLQTRFDNITPTTLFEYPNINALVSHLDGHAKTEKPQPPQSTSPIDKDQKLLSLLEKLQSGKISLDESISQTEKLYE